MRVLITGGYGFIGAWIIKALLEKGASVWVYDLKEDARRMRMILSEEQVRKVVFIPGNVTDQLLLTSALKENAISHIIHLAGLQVPTCRANPILGAQVNVMGTLAVFEAIRTLGEQVKRVVYASSAAVFGPPEAYGPGRQPDDARLLPSTHYGYFKCCNEGNARIYFQDFGISSIGLRPWTVYGVGRDLGMTSDPTKAIKSVVMNRPFHIAFGGITDFQYVEDVAQIFVRCLEAPYKGAKSYNLRGAVVDIPAFLKTLIEIAPEAAKLITHGTSQLAIAYDLDDAGLQKDIGDIPSTSLKDGIRKTLEIFQKLKAENRLTTEDLEAAKPAVVTVDEP
ncbi:NAD(P)-dependent oxidoreductase [Telmatocola sphagniphila]|uniref:NAD(P)-dependent oxidoreductase n=1 Tax=Telmatocola sphagniphila TaxID=1123043 RepID=A0A8E6B7G0_9BACT|nr:NAD(P)-dependent oxidoreductase [Telmatocola sphagniphila]QVL32747.1 NAD(P)-dependent oxidoreductase [Telmatocola sphagniphila]